MTVARLVLERSVSSFRPTVTQPNDLIANPDALALDLWATSGEAAIAELHGHLGSGAGAIKDQPRFLADLLERMRLASVCIAEEIAMPHARTAAVDRMVLAVGRCVQPVAFDADHPRVRLVFLIGTPKEAAADYLKLVAGLSRRLKSAATRKALLAAPSEGEFLAILARGAEVKR